MAPRPSFGLLAWRFSEIVKQTSILGPCDYTFKLQVGPFESTSCFEPPNWSMIGSWASFFCVSRPASSASSSPVGINHFKYFALPETHCEVVHQKAWFDGLNGWFQSCMLTDQVHCALLHSRWSHEFVLPPLDEF